MKTIQADLNEILFEDREKNYGAYKERKNRGKRTILAVFLVTGTFSLLVAAPLWFKDFFPNEKIKDRNEVVIDLKNWNELPTPPIKEDVKLPEPPKQEEAPAQVKTIAVKIPEPVPVQELKEPEQTIHATDSLRGKVLSFKDQEGKDTGFDIGKIDGTDNFPSVLVDEKEKEKPKTEVKKEVLEDALPKIDEFLLASEMPKPINMGDIKQLIGYPKMAKEAGVEGTVTVRILINEDGTYRTHKVLKSVHPLLSDAVEKQVSKLQFTPALQGKKPIKFWVNVPFQFELK